jgi:hypothetical protein
LSGEIRVTIWMKLAFALVTVMPLRRTSSGSRGSARRTRLLTLVAAWSMSVPISKVTVVVTRPLEVEIELTYSMSSTPLICSSIGAATVFWSASALAPG